MSRKSSTPTLFKFQKLTPTDEHERRLSVEYGKVVGIDEVGRGPLAGPVVAAAVVLPIPWTHTGISDSKKLCATARNEWDKVIRENAEAVGVGWASVEEIDSINILQATFLAMRRAVELMDFSPGYILVDGNHKIPNLDLPQDALVKGDSRSVSIAAASIVAKVARDKYMEEMHEKYPVYKFSSNKGYGTKVHREALKLHGPTPIHRRSFRGVLQEAHEENRYGENI